jgi:hypothetical protein
MSTDPNLLTQREAMHLRCLTMQRDIDKVVMNCVGPRCMAWRWAVLEPVPNPGGKEGTGYCGLAGNPRGVS